MPTRSSTRTSLFQEHQVSVKSSICRKVLRLLTTPIWKSHATATEITLSVQKKRTERLTLSTLTTVLKMLIFTAMQAEQAEYATS